MLGVEGQRVSGGPTSLEPFQYSENLSIMSMSFLLHSPDAAVIWRGPLKMGVIKQFLKDVEWGELDYLIVDAPPGTGDEPLSICQLIEDADGAVIVTTPQEVSILDVRKSINFCRQLKMPVLGVVENMSGFVCPQCGKVTDIFKKGGGEKMAMELGVPFLGTVPIDPAVVEGGDSGTPIVISAPDAPPAKVFLQIAQRIAQEKK
jgi:Mrp family chromosome partitioning ATPase